VTCPRPENIERGYMSSSDQREYDFMEKVRYGCEDNYELDGIFEIVCQQNGNWSEKPSCKGRTAISITAFIISQFDISSVRYRKFNGTLNVR